MRGIQWYLCKMVSICFRLLKCRNGQIMYSSHSRGFFIVWQRVECNGTCNLYLNQKSFRHSKVALVKNLGLVIDRGERPDPSYFPQFSKTCMEKKSRII